MNAAWEALAANQDKDIELGGGIGACSLDAMGDNDSHDGFDLDEHESQWG